MMKPKTLGLSAVLLFLTTLVQASDDILVLEYLVDPVLLCDSDDQCVDVEANTLPDLDKNPLTVKQYDETSQMLLVEIHGNDVWLDHSEVHLSKTEMASVSCSTQKISSKKDSETYSTMGLGEGCSK